DVFAFFEEALVCPAEGELREDDPKTAFYLVFQSPKEKSLRGLIRTTVESDHCPNSKQDGKDMVIFLPDCVKRASVDLKYYRCIRIISEVCSLLGQALKLINFRPVYSNLLSI